jgi:hypothetical protein
MLQGLDVRGLGPDIRGLGPDVRVLGLLQFLPPFVFIHELGDLSVFSCIFGGVL